MSAAQKPETTTVAKSIDRDAGLTPEGRQHMAAIRADRAMTVALRNEAWSKDCSPRVIHAVAEYMRRFRLDVSEVEVLGGNIYRTGYYYRRRIAEMRSAGLVEWSEGDHIGPSVQLDAACSDPDPDIAAWAKGERFRRLRERIRWEVPADATHAYVVRVKLKTDEKVLEGCDWITPTRIKKTKWGEKIADPVGAEEPEKTVITRAWRRCGLFVAAEIPELRAQEDALKAGAEVVEAEIEQITDTEQTREAELNKPTAPMALPAPGDPYGDVAVPTREPERVPERVEAAATSKSLQKTEPAPRTASFGELAESVNKLLKNSRVHEMDRARITVEAANAKTEAELSAIIGRLEKLIEDPF